MRKLETFFFKYFSEETLYSKDAWVRWVFSCFLLAIIISAAVADYLGYAELAIIIISIFAIIFGLFGILWIAVWFYHNWRIKNNK